MDLDGSGTLDVDEFLNLLDAHYSFCDSDPVADLRPVFRRVLNLFDLSFFGKKNEKKAISRYLKGLFNF